MPGEVADQFQVIRAEWRLLRISRHRDDAECSFIGNQGNNDRRPFTHVGEAFDRVLKRVGDHRDTAPRHTTGGGAVHRNLLADHLGGITARRRSDDKSVNVVDRNIGLARHQQNGLLGLG